jgi:DNA topoisomerase-6 subunit B
MPVAPMLILVHVASPWVPFTSESKEAVASYPEIEKEITLAIQEVGRKLRIHLNKRRRYREEKRRRRYIEQYIPHIGEALQGILQLKEEDKEKVIQRLETTLENTRKA